MALDIKELNVDLIYWLTPFRGNRAEIFSKCIKRSQHEAFNIFNFNSRAPHIRVPMPHPET